MGHSHSDHPIACPVRISTSLILSLRNTGVISDTPLDSVPHGSKWWWIRSSEITTALRLAARDLGPNLGLFPEDISTRVMCTDGAMALLLGGIDYEKIKLLGWWRSKQMMMYLHTSARPLLQNFSSVMVYHGDYAQVPSP